MSGAEVNAAFGATDPQCLAKLRGPIRQCRFSDAGPSSETHKFYSSFDDATAQQDRFAHPGGSG